MKSWTTHLRRDDPPVLIPDTVAPGAVVLGPVWLMLHQAWIPALLSGAAMALIALLLPFHVAAVLECAGLVLLALFGHDLRRWSLEHRGYLLAHVLVARTETEALGRLLALRPNLAPRFVPAFGPSAIRS